MCYRYLFALKRVGLWQGQYLFNFLCNLEVGPVKAGKLGRKFAVERDYLYCVDSGFCAAQNAGCCRITSYGRFLPKRSRTCAACSLCEYSWLITLQPCMNSHIWLPNNYLLIVLCNVLNQLFLLILFELLFKRIVLSIKHQKWLISFQ